MALIEFKNKPDTSTPINANNLNYNFNDLNNKIGDLSDLESFDKTNMVSAINEVSNDIIYVDYTGKYGPATATNHSGRFTIPTSTPTGYELIGYEILDNGYANTVITWILSSNNTQCVIGFYTLAALSIELTFKIRGIYKKV